MTLGLVGLLAVVGSTAYVASRGDDGRRHPLVLDGGVPSQGAVPQEAADVALGQSVGSSESAPQDVFDAWASGIESRTGVPQRALVAYAVAQSVSTRELPGCHLSWATLAGLGQVESMNGQLGGGLLDSGRPKQPILGVALDGSSEFAEIADTDQGRYDGDASYDRAVGPLQFLPSTWLTWAADGDRDGRRDPQDIDDGALAAARYLCAAGDLATATGWHDAVFSYNHSEDYVDDVRDLADGYARLSTE